MYFLLPSCEEIPPEALPASDTISSRKSDMPASEPFISKRTVEHSSNCEFLLKIYHFLSFWKSLSSTKLTYTQNALRYLRTNLSLNADVSENTLPFVSQSINNFSDYDISQSVDWECPSLSPHVLLKVVNETVSAIFPCEQRCCSACNPSLPLPFPPAFLVTQVIFFQDRNIGTKMNCLPTQ